MVRRVIGGAFFCRRNIFSDGISGQINGKCFGKERIYPVVVGSRIVNACLFIFINMLCLDVLYRIDPRIKWLQGTRHKRRQGTKLGIVILKLVPCTLVLNLVSYAAYPILMTTSLTIFFPQRFIYAFNDLVFWDDGTEQEKRTARCWWWAEWLISWIFAWLALGMDTRAFPHTSSICKAWMPF